MAYQTAYLKANFTAEYMAALLTSVKDDKDKLAGYLHECRRMGIRVLPPDVNASEADFAPIGADIRFGLTAVRNVGAAAMGALVAERRAKGPFKSLSDFALRLDPKSGNRRQIENLALAGAFDLLESDRSRVHAGVEMILQHANSAASERDSGQVSLFGSGTEEIGSAHV